MARQLKATVIIDGVAYKPGSTPSAEVAERITNPKAWADDGAMPEAATSEETSEEPPRAGAGSTTEAWREYATALGVDFPDDAGRDDIIAAVDGRGGS